MNLEEIALKEIQRVVDPKASQIDPIEPMEDGWATVYQSGNKLFQLFYTQDSGYESFEIGDVAMSQDASDRQDAFPTVKQKLNINGHIVAVTHNPGDQRFEYGLPMRDRYGYLEGTYGNAPDGKAFDFYINPGYRVNDEMPLVFMVSQTTPDGAIDEPKFMLGYPDLSSAREAHAYHAGMDRSGLVEPMDWDDLDLLYEEDEDEDYEDGEEEEDEFLTEEEEGY